MKMRQTLTFLVEDKQGNRVESPEAQAVARCITLLLGVEDLMTSLRDIATSDKSNEEQERMVRLAMAMHLQSVNSVTACDVRQTHADVQTLARRLGLELENIPVQQQQEGLVH